MSMMSARYEACPSAYAYFGHVFRNAKTLVCLAIGTGQEQTNQAIGDMGIDGEVLEPGSIIQLHGESLNAPHTLHTVPPQEAKRREEGTIGMTVE
eukprot:4412851-Amphidinium_carterae.2